MASQDYISTLLSQFGAQAPSLAQPMQPGPVDPLAAIRAILQRQTPDFTPEPVPMQTRPGDLIGMILSGLGDAYSAGAGRPAEGLERMIGRRDYMREQETGRREREAAGKERRYESGQDRELRLAEFELGRADTAEERAYTERTARESAAAAREQELSDAESRRQHDVDMEGIRSGNEQDLARLRASLEKELSGIDPKAAAEQRSTLQAFKAELGSAADEDIAAVAKGEKTVEQVKKEWSRDLILSGLEGEALRQAKLLVEVMVFSELQAPAAPRPTLTGELSRTAPNVAPGFLFPAAAASGVGDLLRGIFGETPSSAEVPLSGRSIDHLMRRLPPQ